MISTETHEALVSFINLSFEFGLVPFKLSSHQFLLSCPLDSPLLLWCQRFFDYMIKRFYQFGILSQLKNNSNVFSKYSFFMLLTLHSVGRLIFLACIAAGSIVYSDFGALDILMECIFCSIVVQPALFQVGIYVFRREICNCWNALSVVMRPIGELELNHTILQYNSY